MSSFSLFEPLTAPRQCARYRPLVYGAYLLHTFAGCSCADLQAKLASVFDALAPRQAAINKFSRSNGTLLRNVRAYAYALYCSTEAVDLFSARPLRLTEFDVAADDKAAVKLALTYQPLLDRLSWFVRAGRQPMSLERMDKWIGNTLQSNDLQTYLAKFAWRKLRFISDSYAIPQNELVADMLLHSLYALQRAYPNWEHPGHMLAIAKTAGRNRGCNLIDEATTAKRLSLTQHSDGTYGAVNVSISVTEGAEFLYASGSDGLVSDRLGRSGASLDPDTEQSIRQLLFSPKLTERQRDYLQLLLGTHDADLSELIGEDNSDAAHTWSFDDYNRIVCQYLRIPATKATDFLRSLRTDGLI